MKKEFLEVILSVFARRKRIAKALGTKKLQRFTYDRAWLRFFGRPRLRQCTNCRIGVRGYLEQGLAFAGMEPVARNFRIRYNFVSARLVDRLITQQIITGHELRTSRRIPRPIEREHPACVMRLDRNPLLKCLPVGRTLTGGWQCHLSFGRFPLLTFALPKHASATSHV